MAKIGDGSSTNIWKDRWIPNNKGGTPTTPKPQSCCLNKVKELITNFRWNRPLIFSTFNGKDAEEILKIPISMAGRADSSYWIASNNGNYTVKSAYKMLEGEEKTTNIGSGVAGWQGETSFNGQKEKDWSKMWRLDIKGKHKTFLWKCLNQALPVNELIYCRTRMGKPICQICGAGEETIEHLFSFATRQRKYGGLHQCSGMALMTVEAISTNGGVV